MGKTPVGALSLHLFLQTQALSSASSSLRVGAAALISPVKNKMKPFYSLILLVEDYNPLHLLLFGCKELNDSFPLTGCISACVVDMKA